MRAVELSTLVRVAVAANPGWTFVQDAWGPQLQHPEGYRVLWTPDSVAHNLANILRHAPVGASGWAEGAPYRVIRLRHVPERGA